MSNRHFTPQSLSFLQLLAQNNNRDWFETNKAKYEEEVRTPALQFIADMADGLAQISPHFLALPRKVGGSLMRVHRDVRFGKDKRPYKTNIGIQFRHEQGKDVHAPGFYVHIEPQNCFIGVGIWRPDSTALGKIRDRLCEHETQWRAVIKEKTFTQFFELSGDSLVRPPYGYPKDHPLIEDIKRKDFIAIAAIPDAKAINPNFIKQVLTHFQASNDFMEFLCQALELRY